MPEDFIWSDKLHLLSDTYLERERWPECLKSEALRLDARRTNFIALQSKELEELDKALHEYQMKCFPHTGTVLNDRCVTCKAYVVPAVQPPPGPDDQISCHDCGSVMAWQMAGGHKCLNCGSCTTICHNCGGPNIWDGQRYICPKCITRCGPGAL